MLKLCRLIFFGTSILGVDADNDLDFEREDQLLQYAQVRGYNYLILLSAPEKWMHQIIFLLALKLL